MTEPGLKPSITSRTPALILLISTFLAKNWNNSIHLPGLWWFLNKNFWVGKFWIHLRILRCSLLALSFLLPLDAETSKALTTIEDVSLVDCFCTLPPFVNFSVAKILYSLFWVRFKLEQWLSEQKRGLREVRIKQHMNSGSSKSFLNPYHTKCRHCPHCCHLRQHL